MFDCETPRSFLDIALQPLLREKVVNNRNLVICGRAVVEVGRCADGSRLSSVVYLMKWSRLDTTRRSPDLVRRPSVMLF
jgi:hypothetical protein